jgi:flagellar biosynthesis chaperone FliJ
MAFRFSLEGLLRLRVTLEQVEESALLRLRQEERLLRQQVEEVAALRLQQRSRRVAALPAGALTGADLQFAEFLGARLALEEVEFRRRWLDKQKDTQRQMEVLTAARRRRQAMQALRDREFSAYRGAEHRREQRGRDELFLLHLLRARGNRPRG